MALLDDAASTARSIPSLAFVPALATILSYEKFAKTVTAGPGGGVKFPLPAALPDLWTFVSVPNTGVSVNLGVPLVLAPVYFVVQAALTAGYLGSIDAAIDGERPDFTRNVASRTLPVLGVQLVVFALTIAGFSLALVGGLIFAPVSVLLGLAVGYLLWAAPILVVVRDRSVGDALIASVTHALHGGRYAGFSVGYLAAGLVASFALSTLVRGRLIAVVLAIVVLAYPLLVVSVATVKFVRSLPGVEDGGDTADRYPP